MRDVAEGQEQLSNSESNAPRATDYHRSPPPRSNSASASPAFDTVASRSACAWAEARAWMLPFSHAAALVGDVKFLSRIARVASECAVARADLRVIGQSHETRLNLLDRTAKFRHRSGRWTF